MNYPIDERIPIILKNSMQSNHRTMVFLIGKIEPVLDLYYLLKTTIQTQPSILWCARERLNFQTPQLIRAAEKQIKQATPTNCFQLFTATANITQCFYNDTLKVLGNTFNILILQNFEAITPNILCRTIETVHGGGLIVFHFPEITSLKQIYNKCMDVHGNFITYKYSKIAPLFNERFILSLSKCDNCLLMNDYLNVLPICYNNAQNIVPIEINSHLIIKAPKEFTSSNLASKALQQLCKTNDQTTALLKCIPDLDNRLHPGNIAITAARGRGKSALLGLLIAYSIHMDYSNIYITAPSLSNVKTLFEFVMIGLNAIKKSKEDYEVIKLEDFVSKISIHKPHLQTVEYMAPLKLTASTKADLIVIDEAAAIPLPIVKSIIGPSLVILSSTINGYEGTGRSLSLKLLSKLRENTNKILHEVQLVEPIRYTIDDPIEGWLTELLCLNCADSECNSNDYPDPDACILCKVNKAALFSGHKRSERLLKRIMLLFVSSHYKNSPNDLQLLADAPAHEIYVLLAERPKDMIHIPPILCAIQVCYEGGFPQEYTHKCIAEKQRPSGDLIAWTISEQFQDIEFGEKLGARIVRIACNTSFQRKGYGTKALNLLKAYYENSNIESNTIEPVNSIEIPKESVLLEEDIKPRKHIGPLLSSVSEIDAPYLDYIGTSYGMTPELFKFWDKNGYKCVYLRQTPNEITGEYTCIMLQPLRSKGSSRYCSKYKEQFRNRFVSLLGFEFRRLPIRTALLIFKNANSKSTYCESNYKAFRKEDCVRMQCYVDNVADSHLVIDIIPDIARINFKDEPIPNIDETQEMVLVAIGLQYKTVEDTAMELGIQVRNVLSCINKIFRSVLSMVKLPSSVIASKKENKAEKHSNDKMIKQLKELDYQQI